MKFIGRIHSPSSSCTHPSRLTHADDRTKIRGALSKSARQSGGVVGFIWRGVPRTGDPCGASVPIRVPTLACESRGRISSCDNGRNGRAMNRRTRTPAVTDCDRAQHLGAGAPEIGKRSGGDVGDYLARVFSRTAVILVSPGGARGRHLSHTTTNLSTSFAIT